MNLKYIKNGFLFFSRLLVAVLFLIAIFTGITLAEDKAAVLKIKWVIDEALRMNPGLQAAGLSWDASKKRVPQVRALDDSNLEFTYSQTRVGEVQARLIF